MLPLILHLGLAAAAAAAPAPSPGPSLPALQGLARPMAPGAGTQDYVRWSLQEMGQAVVVVEDSLPQPLPKVSPGLAVLNRKLRLMQPHLPQPTDLPVAPWMDQGTIGIPGNPAQKSYPLGWGY